MTMSASPDRPTPKPGVMDIAAYVPGKSSAPAGVAKVHKLSSNENPLGASEHAMAAVRDTAGHMEFYPDGSATALREAIGSTYGLNPGWYEALQKMDISGFPPPPDFSGRGVMAAIRKTIAAERALQQMYFGWGFGQPAADWGMTLLQSLLGVQPLQACCIPVFVGATDLLTGKRVVFSAGPAAAAVYASSALAGIVPPARLGGQVLVDGGYSDIAPVDVARAAGAEVVIVVDPSDRGIAPEPANGIDALLRAIEICQNEHAHLRFKDADLVLRPSFPLPIGTLDFRHRRLAIAAGIRATRRARAEIDAVLARR